MISFTLAIEPVAWARVDRGAYGQAYVPGKTRKFKTDLARLFTGKAHAGLFSAPLKLTVDFYVRAPKRKVREHPTARPDLDNFLKCVLDAGNKILWADDSQIVEIKTRKMYDWIDRKPRIEITLEELK